MKLKLIRKEFTPASTIGELWIDDGFFCFVLEDKDRGLTQDESITSIKIKKVFGKTAIPYGTYEIKLTYSNHFKRKLPELLDVKGYIGIRIHRGNTALDSLGCLIVGYKKAYDTVFDSTKAEAALILKIQKALDEGEKIEIEIMK